MSHNRKRFKLIDHDAPFIDGVNPLWLEDDPENWETSERVIKRSTKTFGVVTELSEDLEFIGDGARFLRRAYITRDVEANVTVEEWRQHPDNDSQYLHSTAPFDFMKFNDSDFRVKMPFKTSGLYSKVEAQFKEKFELERLDSLDGDVIEELITKIVALTSREILLLSEFENIEEFTNNFNFGGQFRTILLDIVSNSDQGNINPVLGDDFIQWTNDGSFSANDLNPTANQFFYTNYEPIVKTLDITLALDVFVDAAGSDHFYDAWIGKVNSDGDFIQFNQIYDSGGLTTQSAFSINHAGTYVLQPGDKLIFVQGAGGSNTQGFTSTRLVYSNLNFIVSDVSIRTNSQTKAAILHDIGEKLMQIITGKKNLFYSEFYGTTELGYAENGEFSLTALTLGLWIREFFEEKFEFSIDAFLKTSNTIHCTGYTIDTQDGLEKMIVEDLKFFFQDQVVIDLGEVSDVEFDVAEDFYYSTVKFGYKNPNAENNNALYDESMGLDEFNTQVGSTLPITRTDDGYSKISPARADSYGKEFARRKPKLNYPKDDTRYDKEAFILDLKTGDGEALEERVWQDDLEEVPQNVFSPDTATGFRLTPYRISKRHEWFYRAALVKDFYLDKYIRYANSIGNSELITKVAGEDERSERGSTKIRDAEQPRFTGQYATFTKTINFELSQLLMGKTSVNGRMIPNYFFKCKYLYRGQVRYGYIMEVETQKEGKWKLLTAL